MAGKIIKKLLVQVGIDEVKMKSGMKLSVSTILSSGVAYIIYFITGIIALSKLGISSAILSIILICFITVIIIVLVLGIKDFTPNLMAGFYIYIKNKFQVGDTIIVGSKKGKIVEIGLFEIQLKSSKSEIIFVPNSKILEEDITIIKGKSSKKPDKKRNNQLNCFK